MKEEIKEIKNDVRKILIEQGEIRTKMKIMGIFLSVLLSAMVAFVFKQLGGLK